MKSRRPVISAIFPATSLRAFRQVKPAAASHFWAQFQDGAAVWGNILHAFRARPGVIGALATSLCLLLLVGVLVLNRSESGSRMGSR